MNFENVKIIKVYNYGSCLYIIKYIEDGNIYSKSIISKWLKEINVKSVTVRGTNTFVSLLSDPNKNLSFSSRNTLQETLRYDSLLKKYYQFHTIKKLIKNTSKPKELIQYLEDLEFHELKFLIDIQYCNKKLGAKIKNKFEGELVHYLLQLGYFHYIPDREMCLLGANWTKAAQKKMKRHRIYAQTDVL